MGAKTNWKRVAAGIVGPVLSTSCLWGGSYLASVYPMSHWSHFPIIMTSFVYGLVGMILTFYALIGPEGL